jgi:MOSC domain-containing protein YiiM
LASSWVSDVNGCVTGLFLAPSAGAPMMSRTEVRTAPGGRGLEDDRYARAAGHWAGHRSEPVTLVSAEALEEVSTRLGRLIDPALLRRNVITRGIALDELVGRVFRIGEVLLEGTRPCDPCRYLEELAGIPGLLSGLTGRGGLRATIRREGTIRVGDPVEQVEGAPTSSP